MLGPYWNIAAARELAMELAAANVEVEPAISEIYWVPRPDRIYLVEVDPTAIPSEKHLHPMYFAPEPDLPLPSGVAMVTREEFGNLELPPNWGTWDGLELLWPSKNGDHPHGS